VAGHHLVRAGQADARASPVGRDARGPARDVEEVGQEGRRDPGAGVGDLDDRIISAQTHVDVHDATRAAVLHGVGQEVGDGALDPRRVEAADELGQPGLELDRAVLPALLELLDQMAHQRHQVGGLALQIERLARLQLGDVEELADHRVHARGGAPDARQAARQLARRRAGIVAGQELTQ
jgi:hypothetical protein